MKHEFTPFINLCMIRAIFASQAICCVDVTEYYKIWQKKQKEQPEDIPKETLKKFAFNFFKNKKFLGQYLQDIGTSTAAYIL